MRQYQGDLYSGPFSQFLHVTNELGWHVQPPSSLTMTHHLLRLNSTALSALVLDAWR